jgi:hypothetical protein
MVRIDRYQKKTMLRLLPAILLCAGLQSAQATASLHPGARPPDAIVQAQLLVPTAPTGRSGDTPQAVKAGAKPPAAEATSQNDGQDGPVGMLLAALALITGVAMRRWGMGQQ